MAQNRGIDRINEGLYQYTRTRLTSNWIKANTDILNIRIVWKRQVYCRITHNINEPFDIQAIFNTIALVSAGRILQLSLGDPLLTQCIEKSDFIAEFYEKSRNFGIVLHTPLKAPTNLDDVKIQIMATGHTDKEKHFGFRQTMNNIRREFYWKDMSKDIRQFVQDCDTCIAMKNTYAWVNNSPEPTKLPEPIKYGNWRRVDEYAASSSHTKATT